MSKRYENIPFPVKVPNVCLSFILKGKKKKSGEIGKGFG